MAKFFSTVTSKNKFKKRKYTLNLFLIASRIIPRYDFADVSLEFLYTFAEDDGIYECVATNPYGEDRTRAELKCRPKRSIIYNTQLPEGMEGVSKLQMLEDEIR
jgi:hypothetical protein